MSGRCLGSREASLSLPLLATSASVTRQVIARLAGSVRPCSLKAMGSTCHWRSGAVSRGSLRANPPASATFEVSGPLCVSRQRANPALPEDSHTPLEQHTRAGILGEPGRDHAARGSAAHDHIIEHTVTL